MNRPVGGRTLCPPWKEFKSEKTYERAIMERQKNEEGKKGKKIYHLTGTQKNDES